MKKRFTEEQIVGFLKEAEGCVGVKDLCRRHGFSEGSYYVWRSKYGGLEVTHVKRLRALEVDSDCRFGIGHRRLSIVDLSPAGHQPMHSADGVLVLAFNGEIYNHSALRAELDKAG